MLVNNAGFSTLGPVYRSDPDREIAMIRTDVEAVVHLCSLFTPGMVERRSGCILNVASTAAFQPIPGQAGYGASKAFVLSYSHAIREELRPHGVTVTALCPGPVETGFAEAAGIDPEKMAGAMPKLFWVPAAEVARVGVDGMDDNRAVAIPGLPNRCRPRWAGCRPAGCSCPSWPGSTRPSTTPDRRWWPIRAHRHLPDGCVSAGSARPVSAASSTPAGSWSSW